MSNLMTERWLKLAGLGVERSFSTSLLTEGSTTYPKAVEYLALLGIMQAYEKDVHPVVANYFATLNSATVQVIEDEVTKGTYLTANPDYVEKTSVSTQVTQKDGSKKDVGDMPALPKSEFAVDQGRLSVAEDPDKRNTPANTPTPRGFKNKLQPFQSRTVDRREAANASTQKYVDSTGDSGFGPSKDATSKRSGDRKPYQDRKWSQTFADKVIKEVKDNCPAAPQGFQLVNILQHQHGQGHPDVLLVWQKAAANPQNNEILSFSSKSDEFFMDEDGKMTTEAMNALKEELTEKIDGVILWPIHMKTGDTKRFSALRNFKSLTGDASSAILGSTVALDNLTSVISNALGVAEGKIRATSSKTTAKNAITATVLSEIQTFLQEKFKYQQYECRIKGVTTFKSGDTAANRAVTCDFAAYDGRSFFGTAAAKASTSNQVEIEFTFNAPSSAANTQAIKHTVKVKPRSGTGMDVEEIPKMDWTNPEPLRYTLTKNFGTAINLEDFIKDDGTPDWAAIGALMGTPFNQIQDENGDLKAVAAREPMQDHGWFGAAIKHPKVSKAQMSLNDLLASKKITKDYMRDLGLMEGRMVTRRIRNRTRSGKYSLSTYMLTEKMSPAEKLAALKKRNVKQGREYANYSDIGSYAKFKSNPDAFAGDVELTSFFNEMEGLDSNNDGVVTKGEEAQGQVDAAALKAKAVRADASGADNTVREFEGNWVNLPAGIDADTPMAVEDIWAKVIRPAQSNVNESIRRNRKRRQQSRSSRGSRTRSLMKSLYGDKL